jgi:hypothetical protein
MSDASIVALFKNFAIKNEIESAKANRPIYDDMEVVELRYPGSKNVGVYPADSFSQWIIDAMTGEQRAQTYAERFARQYNQFKMHAQQTKSGTPLDHAAFLTEARRAEMRAQNIYTVEALAAIDGAELKNLGYNGRDLKNQAQAYLDETKTGAPSSVLIAELEALKAKNAAMEDDLNAAREQMKSRVAYSEFDDMSTEALKAYITTNSGVAPQGNVARKTLVKMAQDARPDRVA